MINKIKSWLYQFLRRTQKYTGTDNVYLAKGGSWLTLSRTGALFISLGLGIIWANFVPKEIYGQYKFILSLAGILAIFSLQGMKSATVRAVSRNFDGTIKLILKTKLRWSALILLAGFALAVYYWLNDNQVLALSFLIVGFLSPIINSFSIYGEYLLGKKRFDLGSQYTLIRNFLTAAVIITAIFLTKNVIYIILTYFIASSILSIFFYFLTLKKIPPSQNVDQKTISYGKHLSLIGIIGTIGGQIDKILIFHYLGAIELAIYSFAVVLPDYIGETTRTLKHLALPKLSVKDDQEIKKTIRPKVIRYGLFLAGAVVLYIIFADLVFKLFFPAYMDSVFYSRIYAIAVLGNITFLPRLSFVAKAKTKTLYTYDTTLNIIKILIIFISLYFFGLLGIIVGRVISSFISIPIAFFLFQRS